MNTITIKKYNQPIIVTEKLEKLFKLYPKWGKEFKKRNNIN